MAALSLTCKQCNASLKSVKEAQDHGEATGHSQFEESTEPVLNLQCTICGKPCRNQTEKDMHSRHTGHLEFQNKTDEATAIHTESEMQQASEAMHEALKGDSAASAAVSDMEVDAALEMVPAAVSTELRQQLEDMGFSANKATRALHFCGQESLEAAVTWLAQHEEDTGLDEPLLIPKTQPKKKLTPEEAAQAAEDLRKKIKAKNQKEEAELEKLREKERIRAGKELLEAKRKEDDLKLKRNLEMRRIEKEEEQRARDRIRVKLEEDRRARRRKMGLPEELTEEEKAQEAAAAAQKAGAAKKKGSFVTVKPVSALEDVLKHAGGGVSGFHHGSHAKAASALSTAVSQQCHTVPTRSAVAEKLRAKLVEIKKSHPDNSAGVTTCFQTMQKYLANIYKDPSQDKFRNIRLSNPAFQQRVGAFAGSIEALELCGFKKSADGDSLSMSHQDAQPEVLTIAGSELNNALSNPFFGML
ncbi:hypothetical protein ABBQ32_012149 [Trebouxia sp. C0010 RCD-2024]